MTVAIDYTAKRRATFASSLASHGLRAHGVVWLPLPVIMLGCDNPHVPPGSRGVLVICEHGTDASIVVAVFHFLNADHSLGAPVSAPNPRFVYCLIGAG